MHKVESYIYDAMSDVGEMVSTQALTEGIALLPSSPILVSISLDAPFFPSKCRKSAGRAAARAGVAGRLACMRGFLSPPLCLPLKQAIRKEAICIHAQEPQKVPKCHFPTDAHPIFSISKSPESRLASYANLWLI
jgi:hypothetical protein